MKNLMKAFGTALIISGIFAVTSVSAQTTPAQTTPATTTTTKAATPATKMNNDKIIGTDAKGNKVYQGPKGGQYYMNSKGAKVYEPKGTKITPITPSK